MNSLSHEALVNICIFYLSQDSFWLSFDFFFDWFVSGVCCIISMYLWIFHFPPLIYGAGDRAKANRLCQIAQVCNCSRSAAGSLVGKSAKWLWTCLLKTALLGLLLNRVPQSATRSRSSIMTLLSVGRCQIIVVQRGYDREISYLVLLLMTLLPSISVFARSHFTWPCSDPDWGNMEVLLSEATWG